MLNKLPIMESFLTIQGEGHYAGHLAYFIRLAGCDVGCTWCDVKESWPSHENQMKTLKEIVDPIEKTQAKIVVITGGEPLMYDLQSLTAMLHEKGYRVHVETSGAHPLKGHFDWICLSPKKFKKPLGAIYPLAHELKMVVVNKNDFEWAIEESSKVSDSCLLYLQAEWEKREKQYPKIYAFIASNPTWNISVQTHKYLGLP